MRPGGSGQQLRCCPEPANSDFLHAFFPTSYPRPASPAATHRLPCRPSGASPARQKHCRPSIGNKKGLMLGEWDGNYPAISWPFAIVQAAVGCEDRRSTGIAASKLTARQAGGGSEDSESGASVVAPLCLAAVSSGCCRGGSPNSVAASVSVRWRRRVAVLAKAHPRRWPTFVDLGSVGSASDPG